MTTYSVTVESDVDDGFRLGTLGNEFVQETIEEVGEEVFGGEYFDGESLNGDSARWFFTGCTNVSDDAMNSFHEKINALLKAYRSNVSFSVNVEGTLSNIMLPI
jgi:hypothetical protein